MFVKNRNFRKNPKFKNRTFGQKSNFSSKTEIFVKNRTFGQKSNFSSKTEILAKNRTSYWNLRLFNQNVALHINEHDYSPGDFVVRASADKHLNEFGSVTKVSFDEKQVDLIWRNSDQLDFTLRQSCKIAYPKI